MTTNTNISLIHYVGNKSYFIHQLTSLFPKDIAIFVDLFMGSASVSLIMAERCKHVLANDINDDYKNISIDHIKQSYHYEDCFIYADPPYMNTSNNYKQSFTEKNMDDLFHYLLESHCRFGMSCFKENYAHKKAKELGLHISEVFERSNLKNRRIECLITNYDPMNKKQMELW